MSLAHCIMVVSCGNFAFRSGLFTIHGLYEQFRDHQPMKDEGLFRDDPSFVKYSICLKVFNFTHVLTFI